MKLISGGMKHRKIKMETYCFVICFLSLAVSGLEEGDKCITPEGQGTCKRIWDCLSADRDNDIPLEMCSGENKIVCCFYTQDRNTTKYSELLLLTRTKPPMTPKKTCSPIPNKVTEPMGKSLKKCLEYQEKLVYPCQESQNPNEGVIRENRCNWKPDSLIIGGVDSYRGEFPHMVHLGYGKYKTEWECGGVLLSEKFVLTAGHCTKDPRFGPVNKIRIAFLYKSEIITDANLYKVKEIYKHPEYKSPWVYNDIALLESDRPMQLGRYAVPACLHDGRPMNDTEVYATGWGSITSRSNTFPDILQKVALERFSNDECQQRYSNIRIRHMPWGYDKKTQICYGHRTLNRDSCNGDSGGPLQVVHPDIMCMYLVTGIVSTSKWCAQPDMPGINTRVSYYLSWIESIVWP